MTSARDITQALIDAQTLLPGLHVEWAAAQPRRWQACACCPAIYVRDGLSIAAAAEAFLAALGWVMDARRSHERLSQMIPHPRDELAARRNLGQLRATS